jgi:DNA polymerase-3 subunit epsilon
MTRGQETLDIVMAASDAPSMALGSSPLRASLIVVRASDEELAAHVAMCERIALESKGRCLWMRIPVAA